MTDFDAFERRLAAALRSDADASVAPFEAGAIADAAIADAQSGAKRLPRGSTRPARRFGRDQGTTLLAAAAFLLVGGALAVGSGVLRLPSVVPPPPAPSFGVVATGSPDTTSASPSSQANSSPEPSLTPAPIVWTQASLQEDWPAPVRPEPAGGASVQPMPLTYLDPIGDTGSDTDPWVDLRGVMADTSRVDLKLLSSDPPVVNPTERWIAYGVVTDDDRDGVPDWRFGIDNTTPASFGPPNRVWRTNLHTGQTFANPLGDTSVPVPLNGSDNLDQYALKAGYPSGSDPSFRFGGALEIAVPDNEPMPSGGRKLAWGHELDMPFYTWASVIVNGRVVATDFAPDAGWLVATRGAKPGGAFLLGDPFPHLSMTVREGWQDGGVIDGIPFDRAWSLTQNSSKSAVAFVIVDDHATEACTEQGTIDPLLGLGVDDVVTLLAGLPSIDFSENRDVTLDGYRGTYLEFNGGTGCSLGTNSTSLEYAEGFHQVWILEVDGVPLVIDALSLAPSETVNVELRQMVESIQFDR
jgi:hypothetical protein